MSEKYSHSKQTLQSETSRRTFLKTGAAAAGAALLGAAVKATPSSATDQAQDNIEEVQLLFVQTSKDKSHDLVVYPILG
jgi:anaerobic selenocysteine-containing dehydrogenase